MSSFLYSLGRWAFRARWLVLVAWVVVLVALIVLAGLFGSGTDNTYKIPGTESQSALDSLARTFSEVSGTSAQMIVVAPPGEAVQQPEFEAAIETSITQILTIPQVSNVTSPYAATPTGNISPDSSAALVPIQLSVTQSAVDATTSDALQAAGRTLSAELPPGSTVAVGGQLFSQTSAGISITELIGVLVAFIVLLFTFGSFVAAGLPLVTALLGVGASLAVILTATRFLTITSTTPLLSLMLGLAVGIDYALFIISRHQENLKEGLAPEESAARAIATAGSAVVFAAITVIIALLGLSVARIPFLTTMGVAAAFAVAVAVLVSMTLTPALLGFAGKRAVGKRFRVALLPAKISDGAATGDNATPPARGELEASKPADDDDSTPRSLGELEASVVGNSVGADHHRSVDVAAADPSADPRGKSRAGAGTELVPVQNTPAGHRRASHGFFFHWVGVMTKWPIVTVLAGVILLGLATVPAGHLRLALPDAGSLEVGAPGRVTYDLVSKYFGPGYNGPLIVTGSIIQSTDPVGLMATLGTQIATVPGVAAVPLSTPNPSGDTGIVQVIPKGGPDSPQTKELVATLRAQHDTFLQEDGVDLSVTGYTAAGIDISARLAQALLPFALLVVGLSLILLMMVFRSIVVPITAALGYLLSIGAALGVSTLVFVDGVLAGPLNVNSLGSVISFMPIILMGVLFGLAMDYEVFLVTRMREHFVHHGNPREAVEQGFIGSARVVTAAAIIMFAVFAAFIPEGDASIQPIAVGLAVGVLVDAFIVRMSLIPAVLVLFGRHAWWLPAWLERALPSFDVEGEGLRKELAVVGWPDPTREFAIAAEHATVSNASTVVVKDLHLLLPFGDVLIVRGTPQSGRSTLLLTLAGRLQRVEGPVKVAGFALPMRAAKVRSLVGVARPSRSGDPVADLRAALSHHAVIVIIDDLDAVMHPADRAAFSHLLESAWTDALARDSSLTIIASCGLMARLDELLPMGPTVHTALLTSGKYAHLQGK
ncbi:MMPL family transporter [Homoserinimonas sp. OAct 916]|uniref:MMPL family transporter n=1 Tax=Homoserinimonas sp. OAct 916 TaxID=2211450 RepID=UPI0018E508F0|nr:MMPL family transporter [Homoserinimonas sp. OAct 916]